MSSGKYKRKLDEAKAELEVNNSEIKKEAEVAKKKYSGLGRVGKAGCRFFIYLMLFLLFVSIGYVFVYTTLCYGMPLIVLQIASRVPVGDSAVDIALMVGAPCLVAAFLVACFDIYICRKLIFLHRVLYKWLSKPFQNDIGG